MLEGISIHAVVMVVVVRIEEEFIFFGEDEF